MFRTISIRSSLLLNLLAIVVLIVLSIELTTSFVTRRAMQSLSDALTRQALDQTEDALAAFFAPVDVAFVQLRAWARDGVLQTDDLNELRALLQPFLIETPQISSLLLADERGWEFMLLRRGSPGSASWRIRVTNPDALGGEVRLLDWTGDFSSAVDRIEPDDYDPRERPWYQGVVRSASPRETHWTEPYRFHTTQEPGITASTMIELYGGESRVIGFDVLLADISEFTLNLPLRESGGVLVLDERLRMLAFPSGERYRDPDKRRSDLLRVPDDVDWALASSAGAAFAERSEQGKSGAVRFFSNAEPWWGDGRQFPLGVDRSLWIFVFAPEEELLFGIKHLRWWQLGVGLAVTLIAVLQAFAMAKRFSRPVEALVEQSDRIGQGMLDDPARVRSRITEIRRLGNAQERMRKALKSLLKMERDLQVARSIQQQTFPKSLPKLSGFDLAAWSNPADETGGDTYDVIGFRRELSDKPILPSVHADRAVFLLADATGHGIGPALIVTQIRAMLRMAVRMGEDLETLARHINAQLCADLLDGRFITAWLAELDAGTGELRSFSAGQGPIATYSARSGEVRFSDADAPPFGVMDDLPIAIKTPRVLERGDVVLVASDGIYEASNRTGEQYGQQRVSKVLSEHHGKSAEAILAALRQDVERFTAGQRPLDDQTVVVIRRGEG